jgi:hypothetical protein
MRGLQPQANEQPTKSKHKANSGFDSSRFTGETGDNIFEIPANSIRRKRTHKLFDCANFQEQLHPINRSQGAKLPITRAHASDAA